MTSEKKKFKVSALKNWIILGAVGVGGYYLYQNYVKPELSDIKSDLKNAAKPKPANAGPEPDLNGPAVGKFQIASTRSTICITTADPRFVYAPITSILPNGYKTFSAPVSGRFTRRLLCKGAQKWAELKPGA